MCFNTAVAWVATTFVSIETFGKASCSSGGFENLDIDRRTYGPECYVCNDEDECTFEVNENAIIVCNTASGLCEERDKEPHVYRIEPIKHEVHRCLPNPSTSILNEQKPERYKL